MSERFRFMRPIETMVMIEKIVKQKIISMMVSPRREEELDELLGEQFPVRETFKFLKKFNIYITIIRHYWQGLSLLSISTN